MAQTQQIVYGQVVTASGQSAPFEVPNAALSIQVDVTAVSGTSPSLALSIAWSDDGSTFSQASPADTFTAITAVGSVAESFTPKGEFYRLEWTVTGTTPSFTVTAFERI